MGIHANKGIQLEGGGVKTWAGALRTLRQIRVKMRLGNMVADWDWCENKEDGGSLWDEKKETRT